MGLKRFNTMYNVGSAKYVINCHNGINTHSDGSDFFDIDLFRNKVKFNKECKQLIKDGYIQTN